MLTHEAEYIALSLAIREVIPLIQLLKDHLKLCEVIDVPPEIYYKVFKDNKSCITVTESKKLLAYMKYIAIKYYYFYSLVDSKVIRISYIETKN